MNREEAVKRIQEIFYLASCAIRGEKADAERLRNWDIPRLLRLAKWSGMEAMISMALEDAGLKNEETAAAIGNSQRRSLLMDREAAQIFAKLEEAAIPYAPMKGLLLKSSYSRLGMREMSDCDILIDMSRAEEVRSIMHLLGFREISFDQGITDVYFKEPVINIEIHRMLFYAHRERLSSYYERPFSIMTANPGKNRYSFSPEDFYIYMIAHAYKHYSASGTGLRILADEYVYRKHQGAELDDSYIEAELEKLEIGDFFLLVKTVSKKLFAGEALTEEEQDFLCYLLESGSYGIMKHRVERAVAEQGSGLKGKLRYVKYRLFPPRHVVEVHFPFFHKHKWLLPFLPFYRTFKSFKSARNELAIVFGKKEKKDQA